MLHKYSGCLIFPRQCSSITFQKIINKVTKKLKGWKANCLWWRYHKATSFDSSMESKHDGTSRGNDPCFYEGLQQKHPGSSACQSLVAWGLRPILKGLRLKANIFAWKAIPRSWLQSMSSYSAYVQSNMKKQAHLYSHVEVQPSWTRFELKDVLSIWKIN